jgi:hypothetical protein
VLCVVHTRERAAYASSQTLPQPVIWHKSNCPQPSLESEALPAVRSRFGSCGCWFDADSPGA